MISQEVQVSWQVHPWQRAPQTRVEGAPRAAVFLGALPVALVNRSVTALLWYSWKWLLKLPWNFQSESIDIALHAPQAGSIDSEAGGEATATADRIHDPFPVIHLRRDADERLIIHWLKGMLWSTIFLRIILRGMTFRTSKVVVLISFFFLGRKTKGSFYYIFYLII